MKPETNIHTNLIIRLAKLRDAGLLAELGARTFSDTFAADNTPENMSDYLAVCIQSRATRCRVS